MTKQIEIFPNEFRSYVGLHYKHEGKKYCSMQLLNEEGKAVAIADFVNCGGKLDGSGLILYRFEFADHARAAAKNWKDGLISAPLSEMLT